MRLIDADVLLRKLQEQQKYSSVNDSRGRAKAIVEVIDAPTIDAQPVKRGKWSEYSRNALEIYIECTNCCVASRPIHLQMVTKDGSGLPDFCPNCGADMREEAHNVD